MHRQRLFRRLVSSIALAACAAFPACDRHEPTEPTSISFSPIPLEPSSHATCAGLTGVFATPSIVVFRDTGGDVSIFTGNPALLATFTEGQFTSNVFATGLPPVTNVGSFSITGGFVVFGERPFIPRLLDTTQRFNCQLVGSQLVLVNNDALFDFGSGRGERARIHLEFSRRQP